MMIAAPSDFDEFIRSLFICDSQNNVMINLAFIESAKESYSSWNAYSSSHLAYTYMTIDGVINDYNTKIAGRYITMNHMSSNLHIMGYRSLIGTSGTSFIPFDMHFVFNIKMLKDYYLSKKEEDQKTRESVVNRFDLLDI